MSKVIKSTNTTLLDSEKKTISLKKIRTEQVIDETNGSIKPVKEMDVFQLADAELKNARAEAEAIRLEAQAEYESFQEKMNEDLLASQMRAEELYKQAEENGYNAGFQQGLEEGQKQYESFIQEAKRIIESSKNDYIQCLEEAEPVIVQLASKIAEKILSETLREEQQHWLSLVKGVVNEVREQDQVKLYVHPHWYELTLSHKDELRLLLPNCEQLYIYPDLHLEEFGCTIETPYGKIDASIDSQLTEIKDALLERLKEMGGYEGS